MSNVVRKIVLRLRRLFRFADAVQRNEQSAGEVDHHFRRAKRSLASGPLIRLAPTRQ
jgi:hypothetical protein